MSDSWTCDTCKAMLRCSCNSSECSFDYDIRAHIRNDLRKAIETARKWMDADVIINITKNEVEKNV
jgi:hypothetical protein